MAFKAHHIAWTVATLVGALYLFHMWSTHGTFKSTAAGLGINR
jgi:hypothetical protein